MERICNQGVNAWLGAGNFEMTGALSILFFVAVLAVATLVLFANLWTYREAIAAALLGQDTLQPLPARHPVRVRRAPQFAPRTLPAPTQSAAA